MKSLCFLKWVLFVYHVLKIIENQIGSFALCSLCSSLSFFHQKKKRKSLIGDDSDDEG